jgi:hypothetical protein
LLTVFENSGFVQKHIFAIHATDVYINLMLGRTIILIFKYDERIKDFDSVQHTSRDEIIPRIKMMFCQKIRICLEVCINHFPGILKIPHCLLYATKNIYFFLPCATFFVVLGEDGLDLGLGLGLVEEVMLLSFCIAFLRHVWRRPPPVAVEAASKENG